MGYSRSSATNEDGTPAIFSWGDQEVTEEISGGIQFRGLWELFTATAAEERVMCELLGKGAHVPFAYTPLLLR